MPLHDRLRPVVGVQILAVDAGSSRIQFLGMQSTFHHVPIYVSDSSSLLLYHRSLGAVALFGQMMLPLKACGLHRQCSVTSFREETYVETIETCLNHQQRLTERASSLSQDLIRRQRDNCTQREDEGVHIFQIQVICTKLQEEHEVVQLRA